MAKPERWELEADIAALRATGHWVDGKIPEWARKKADEFRCRPASSAVIEWALDEIIRMLKEELAIVRARDPHYPGN